MGKIHGFVNILLAVAVSASALAGCQGAAGPQQTITEEEAGSAGTEAGQGDREDHREAGGGEDAAAGRTSSEDSRILIAYFAVAENSDVDAASSASMVVVDQEAKGRISYLAELIQEGTGGELFSIDTAVVYPGDGEKLVDYAAEEQDRDERPEILNHIDNLDKYDTIFVGFLTGGAICPCLFTPSWKSMIWEGKPSFPL